MTRAAQHVPSGTGTCGPRSSGRAALGAELSPGLADAPDAGAGPRQRGGGDRPGGAALQPGCPGLLPVAPPVVPGERAWGAGDGHGVAPVSGVPPPGCAVDRHPDAAVAAVLHPQAPETAGALVQVLAAVGDLHVVVDDLVVVPWLVRLDVRRGHPDRVVTAHGEVDAAGGVEVVAVGVVAAHSAADRDLPGERPVGVEAGIVGFQVDLDDVRIADLERTAQVAPAPQTRPGRDAGQVRGQRHVLVGRPVALRTEYDLAVRGPEPRPGDRDVAADLEGALHRVPVRAGHVVVEVDDDRHADADGLTGVRSDAADLEDPSRALGGEMRDLGRRRALAVLGDGGDGVGGG